MLASLPAPSEKRIALRVTPSAERALRGGHPWLYNDSIRQQSHEGKLGDLAVIFDSKRHFLAIGLYDPLSPIRVRILQHKEPSPINRDWFRRKIELAWEIRSVLPEDTTGYRLIHGENDGLPGLVLDNYAQTFVLKIYSAAWIPFLGDLLPQLMDLSPMRIILRLSRDVARRPEHLYGLEDGMTVWGSRPDEPVLFKENDLIFEADPIRGQKTGFFLDQRDNRAKVEPLANGLSVLNVFAYTGGFSVYAARGGAQTVISVDSSKPALEAAERNFAHNIDHPEIANTEHKILVGNAFQILPQLHYDGVRYDMVIIDPPSFAKKRAEIETALAQYRRLTRLGLNILNPGGIFIQASCSSRISEKDFIMAVHQEAQQNGHPLQEIQRTGHPLDHPIGFPEGVYLKCLFARTTE